MKYRVWIFGNSYDHKTLTAAIKRAERALNYCPNPQVIEIATGKLVYGSPE